MGRKSKYTKELLAPIVAKNTSMRQVLLTLNLKITGGNYCYIKQKIDEHSIDTSHFLGQGHNKGKRSRNRSQPEDYLVVYDKTKSINTHAIKKRMIRDGAVTHRCMRCGRTKWFEQPIPLALHHKDGDRWNNIIDNLEVLCYNCHGLTENYSGNSLVE
jgi:5-methylcytosine-specific restriction endonuclease McrA